MSANCDTNSVLVLHTMGMNGNTSYQDKMCKEPDPKETGSNQREQRKYNYDALSKDRALRLYFAHLTKPNKPLGLNQQRATFRAWTHFLERLGEPITETAVSKCIAEKKNNPRLTRFEEELTLWKAESKNSKEVQNRIGRILGTFRWNFARLEMTIHIRNDAEKTKPIAEPTLLAIYNALGPKEKDALELMTFGAERVNALGTVPVRNIHLIEDSNVAILDIPAENTKVGERHPAAIPKALAERLLEQAQEENRTALMPDIKDRFRHITRLAKEKYQVRLTSHYLRKRFETRCERIPADVVNPNHWVILMGSKPTLGHMPDIYSLLSDREIVHEYETEIIPRLELTGQDTKPRTSEIEQLKKENNELKEQLLQLTKLLTEKLQTIH